MTTKHNATNPAIAALLTLGASISAAHAQTAAEDKPAPAYYIAEFELTDPEGIRPYSEQVDATFEPYGGRYIVRGGEMEHFEGEAPNSRIIAIEFDSIEKAREWYNSPEYSALRPIRQRSGETDVYIVEGLPH